MKSKHTPGEWLIDGYLIVGEVTKKTYDGSGGVIICDWNPDTQYALPSKEQQLQNAKLIAAAPELLQMVYDLKQCVNRLSQDGLSQSERDKEAQWEGEAHELLTRINPDYYQNANTTG